VPKDPVTGKQLTDAEYDVLRRGATDAPFRNRYVDNHADGMYHCRACDAPLFASRDKFDSGSGWPSFTCPVQQGAVRVKTDTSHGMVRTEVLCAKCGAHQGHVFDDGPGPDGLRFCINSSSLQFQAE
jgi:peptide-methionine (R)-S-oxide reductase